MNDSGPVLRLPPALRPGALLAVISPASAAKRELVERGCARLMELGYRTKLGAHALASGPLYYAGPASARVEDLHSAFADPEVDGILCTRGGWGTAELLPLLDRELIRKSPKLFVGYSDITSLQIWFLENAGLVTFSGPMVAADFSRDGGVDLNSWRSAVTREGAWMLDQSDGLRTLRPGFAEGQFAGGCLSLVAESLGTPYAPRKRKSVLFLEDIGTKPYQWDRMLLHLRLAGVLDHVTGIVFGDMAQCVSPEQMELLESALLHSLQDFPGPIAIGLRSGHVNGANLTFPFGVQVKLNCSDPLHPQVHFPDGLFAASVEF